MSAKDKIEQATTVDDIAYAIKRLQRTVSLYPELSVERTTVSVADLRLALEHLLRCGECGDCQEHMLTPHQAKRCPRMWKKAKKAKRK